MDKRSIRPGDQLRLKVSLVDPRRDEIRFQEVTSQEAQQVAGLKVIVETHSPVPGLEVGAS